MTRRWGWYALAGIGAAAFLAMALGGAWGLGLALRDGEAAGAVLGAGPVVLGLVFWRWITLGAWFRARPPLDHDTGQPVAPAEPIGPWGIVGQVLLVLIVGGFTILAAYAASLDRSSTDAAEEVREQAERTVRGNAVTVARVEQAQVAHGTWAWDGGAGRPDPYDELAVVPGAELVDVSVRQGQASLLFSPDDAPPCVVVTVDADDLVRSRLTTDCR